MMINRGQESCQIFFQRLPEMMAACRCCVSKKFSLQRDYGNSMRRERKNREEAAPATGLLCMRGWIAFRPKAYREALQDQHMLVFYHENTEVRGSRVRPGNEAARPEGGKYFRCLRNSA
jgi:hypothetical protein